MTSDSVHRPGGEPWDLLVIGGGTAGLTAATTAASLGAAVLLAEPARTGGECLWTGCVPSKALLHAAHTAHDARRADRFGIGTGEVTVDYAAVRAHVRASIDAIEPVDSPEALRAAGVAVVEAGVEFTGPATARVGGDEVPFRQALIATGSRPLVPPVPGLDDASPLTNETVWDLESLPTQLLIIGGGRVGCELAQAFARLGSAVTLVEQGQRLLAGEIERVSTVVRAALADDGVDVRCGTGVREVDAGVAHLTDATDVAFDAVLVATGRRAGTADLGLAAAGVETGEDGYVRVDDARRTTNPAIWAAGDVTGGAQLTHVAGVHASLAASNAVLGVRRTVDPLVPQVLFTQPEIASVGAQEGTAHTIEHDDVDRAVADGETHGFTRLVTDRRGRVIGATIVSPRAGESLAEVALAVHEGVRLRTLAAVTHAYPTYSDGAWKAGIQDVRDTLASRVPHAITGVFTRVTRARADRRLRRRDDTS